MSSDDRRQLTLSHAASYLLDALALGVFCFGLVVLGAGLGSGVVSGAMLAGGAAPLALGFAHLYYRIRTGRPEHSGWGDGSDETGEESAEDPLSILQARYARGEIDDAEFERRLDRLLDAESSDPEGREEALDRVAR